MSRAWPIAAHDPDSALSSAALLVLLIVILFVGAERRRSAGGISLAPPVLVPFDAEDLGRAAGDLGTAIAVLIHAERRREHE